MRQRRRGKVAELIDDEYEGLSIERTEDGGFVVYSRTSNGMGGHGASSNRHRISRADAQALAKWLST